MKPKRTRELLNILIDNMIEENGLHSKEVLEKLIGLGFTKKELIELQFSKEDIENF